MKTLIAALRTAAAKVRRPGRDYYRELEAARLRTIARKRAVDRHYHPTTQFGVPGSAPGIRW